MTYDFVIVGAGSAGCVLAARLSEDPATRVLLLEAGPPDSAPEIAVPAAFATLLHGPRAWPDATTGGVACPHGRTLGGSSSVNGMVYVRGQPLDYDGWDRDGWSYEDPLPCFERAERQLSLEPPRYVHPLSRAWLESAPAFGDLFRLTMRDGRRWSAADAYLRPAIGRPNLDVETDAHVTRIVVDVQSRGRLTLRSADPFDRPLIDPGYLRERADLEAMLAGVRLAREIAARGPLAELIDGEHAPGEQALERWVRATVGTAFHPAGTCALGGPVDDELRVRAVDGLRVADASVMPKVPRGNTNGPVIALAERVAELILSPRASGTRRVPTRTPLGTGG